MGRKRNRRSPSASNFDDNTESPNKNQSSQNNRSCIKLKALSEERDELFAAVHQIADSFIDITPAQAQFLKFSLDRLKELQSQFYVCQKQIIEINQQVSAAERVNVSDVRKSFDELVLDSQKLYLKKTSKVKSTSEENQTSPTFSQNDHRRVRLPRIELPRFSGKVDEWLPFSNLFKASIHSSPNLSDSEKFQYLLSLLDKQPLKLIRSLEFTEKNYSVAWELLCSYFQNERRQVSHHFSSLITLSPIKTDSDVSNFMSRLQEHVNSLASIDYKVDEYGPLLVTIVLGKFSDFHKRRFEDSRKDCTQYPKIQEIFDFLKSERARISDSIPQKSSSEVKSSKNALVASNSNSKPNSNSNSNSIQNASSKKCPCCNEAFHCLYFCAEFKKLKIKDRRKIVQDNHYCFTCLKKHAAPCSSNLKCRHCDSSHNTMLCFEQLNKQKNNTPVEPKAGSASSSNSDVKNNPPVTLAALTGHDLESTVLLGTTLVDVKGPDGRFHTLRGVLDCGATTSYITTEGCQKLGLVYDQTSDSVSGIGGGSALIRGKTTCLIKPRDSKGPVLTTETLVIDRITSDLPCRRIPKGVRKHFEDLRLADPDLWHTPSSCQFLIGADVYSYIITGEKRVGRDGIPPALSSIFGWVITGRVARKTPRASSFSQRALICTETDVSTDSLLRQFWELEQLPNLTHSQHPDDIIAENIFREKHYRQPDGRYVVPMLLKETASQLGTSKNSALNRLTGLRRRLDKDSNLKIGYSNFLQEYEDLNHMTLVPCDNINQAAYYIPHHCVLREESISTKLRVVFDGSQKTTSNISLNDVLYAGPKLQLNIFDVIMKFRLHKYAFTCDIVKMFRQILILPEDRKYQHIFWNKNNELQEYELNTVTYGTTPAPFLSIRTLHQLAMDDGHRYPLASKAIFDYLYVDDFAISQAKVQEILETQRQLIELLKLAGFELQKWASNCVEVLSQVPQEHCVTSFNVTDENHMSKLLGIFWDAKRDTFSFHTNITENKITKRIMLSTIARIYDPLGWLCPIVFRAKVMIQQLWLQGLDWDAPVSPPVDQEWTHFVTNLPAISDIQIDRCTTLPNAENNTLVGFSDASDRGYAAVVYLRSELSSSVKISILAAKSRVAPTKTISIPKLELCGAQLLSALQNQCKLLLENEISIKNSVCFTDSEVVLAWLKTIPCKLKTFEANRVTKILEDVEPDSWRYVPSSENPADVASRGCSPEQLNNHPLWWTGPEWLQKQPEFWPKFSGNTVKARAEIASGFKSKEKTSLALITTQSDFWEKLIEKYSSFSKLKRVTAWLLRFSKNVRLTPENRNNNPALSVQELDQSLTTLVKVVQEKHLFDEIKTLKKSGEVSKHLKALQPFIDQNGVVRVGGRLRNANLPFKRKHPMLLPKNNHFVNLIIDAYHLRYLHAGPRLLQSLLARQFWITAARSIIRSRLNKCLACFQNRPINTAPLMGDLPPSRVNPPPKAFTEVACDYAGPFMLKEHKRRNPKLTKAYFCLFTCMATKAVHLEAVSDLSTDAFLAAFDRFVSRRGLCRKMFSDNATNFVGAKRQLSEIFNFIKENQNQITEILANREVEWKFIPPSAPHFGGLWEAGVKSAKYHLKRIIGTQTLTFEEFTTVLTKIESIMNSRPLCSLSTDAAETDVLTPGHFLVGGPLVSVPEWDVSAIKLNRLSRWQLVQQITQQFWSVWSRDYLHTLIQRSKWQTDGKNITPGTVVIIEDNNMPPNQWRKGIIEAVHPGKDHIIRVVTVRTSSGSFKRPAIKIYPLPNQ